MVESEMKRHGDPLREQLDSLSEDAPPQYRIGVRAWCDGQGYLANPHEPGSEAYNVWLAGWTAADGKWGDKTGR